jgi:hypothetical protein
MLDVTTKITMYIFRMKEPKEYEEERKRERERLLERILD